MPGATGRFEYRGDSDWFKVHFEAGKTYQVSVSDSNVALALRLPDGAMFSPPVAYSNLIRFVAPVSGDYWVSASDFGGATTYVINAGEGPDANPASAATELTLAVGETVDRPWVLGQIPDDWYAIDLIAGQSYALRSGGLGDDLYVVDMDGNIVARGGSQLHITATESGTYFAGISYNASYSLTLQAVADDHGETASSAGSLAVGLPGTGIWEAAADTDWHAVSLAAGSSYRLTLQAPQEAGTIRVFDADGNVVWGGSEFGAGNSTIFSPSAAGTYYLSAGVGSMYYNPLPNWSYTLAATQVAGDLPDNSFTTGTLAIGGTAAGTWAGRGDVDWMAVDLTAGQSYNFAMTTDGGSAGLALYDDAGNEVASTFENFGTTVARLVQTANVTGTYYLAIRGADFDGTSYSVSAATFLDDLGNNNLTTGTLTVGGTASGTFEVADDRDWFAVELTAGMSYVFASDPYSTVTIRDAQGSALTQTGWGDTHFSPLVSGTYYLEALGYSGEYSVGIAAAFDDFREDALSTGVLRTPINGTAGNETLAGTAEHEIVIAQAGDDLIIASGGDDLYNGGAGIDTVSFASLTHGISGSLLPGGSFVGGGQRLTLASIENVEGTRFDDIIQGRATANLLRGGDGNDRLDGLADADRLEGGKGDDTYVVDNVGDLVIELASQGFDTVESDIVFSLYGLAVEALNLTGTGAINGQGNGQDNRITGNAAANVLAGGAGNDRLDGGLGADTVKGGLGNDVLVVDDAGDKVQEKAGEGTDTVETWISYNLANNVETLKLMGEANLTGNGNGLANGLFGNTGNNVLNGGAGADTMAGGAGDDRYVVDNAGDTVVELAGGGMDLVEASVSFSLAGQAVEALTLTGAAAINGTGNGLANVLTGNGAANVLGGGDGDDALHGGLGADMLTGGKGLDSFWFETKLGAGNVDTINGFKAADDTIVLDRSIFTGIATDGVLAAGAFRMGVAAIDADDRILYDKVSGDLWYDADGAGGVAAVLFAHVVGSAPITSADFLIVA